METTSIQWIKYLYAILQLDTPSDVQEDVEMSRYFVKDPFFLLHFFDPYCIIVPTIISILIRTLESMKYFLCFTMVDCRFLSTRKCWKTAWEHSATEKPSWTTESSSRTRSSLILAVELEFCPCLRPRLVPSICFFRSWLC